MYQVEFVAEAITDLTHFTDVEQDVIIEDAGSGSVKVANVAGSVETDT